MDDMYYQQVAIKYMTIECEPKYKMHIAEDVKFLFVSFAPQDMIQSC